MTATLGAALEAFIRELEYCGELATGIEVSRNWATWATIDTG